MLGDLKFLFVAYFFVSVIGHREKKGSFSFEYKGYKGGRRDKEDRMNTTKGKGTSEGI